MRTCQFVNGTFKSMKLIKFNMMIIKDWRFNFWWIGTWSNVDSEKRLKSGEDTGVIIESGSRIESPSWDLGSYSFSSSILGKDNLPKCQCDFQNSEFGQVQMGVLK